MFDTHCHLNFKAFVNNLEQVIKDAQKAGVNFFLVPGTDIASSKKALEIANQFENVYAAVGIHPHHAFGVKFKILNYKFQIEKLLNSKKVVAIGEVGLDKHVYKKTKYESYNIDQFFIDRQKEILIKQIKLAIKYKKSLILHNREAADELLNLLSQDWHLNLCSRTVFHCCEPYKRLLDFAIKNRVYLGVDGDVTYNKVKQEFVKKIPLDLLVLETDAPFLLPEPQRSEKKNFNAPKNLPIIAKFIADLKKVSLDALIKKTTANAKKLFAIY